MKYQPIIEVARNVMIEQLGQRRAEGTLSKAHDESHCEAVAKYGGATARALMEGQGYNKLSDRLSALTQIAGYLHDVKREATEQKPHGPVSAAYFAELLKTEPFRQLVYSHDDFDIFNAIDSHEINFAQALDKFGNPIGKINRPSTVIHGIITGDKALEASGYRVVERRSFFTGKERLENGDLKKLMCPRNIPYVIYPDDSAVAVLGETIVRLYGRNPIDSYPDWLKPFAQELHAVQYQLYRGLLDYFEWKEENALRYFELITFPKIETVADAVRAQKHLDGNYFSAEQYPVLHAEIEKLGGMNTSMRRGLAQASHDVVKKIAMSESPEAAIDEYKTDPFYHDPALYSQLGDTGFQYKKFFDGIVGYREGSADFLENFKDSVRREVERLSKG